MKNVSHTTLIFTVGALTDMEEVGCKYKSVSKEEEEEEEERRTETNKHDKLLNEVNL